MDRIGLDGIRRNASFYRLKIALRFAPKTVPVRSLACSRDELCSLARSGETRRRMALTAERSTDFQDSLGALLTPVAPEVGSMDNTANHISIPQYRRSIDPIPNRRDASNASKLTSEIFFFSQNESLLQSSNGIFPRNRSPCSVLCRVSSMASEERGGRFVLR